MSRTKKGKKGPGYEYWSKRPYSTSSPGRVSKNITHRKERAQAKRQLEKALKNTDELPSSWFGKEEDDS